MPRHRLSFFRPALLSLSLLLLAVTLGADRSTATAASNATSGSLEIIAKDGIVSGSCPLKHTEVRGAITGFLARVSVTQTFENSAPEKIEAVYTFPLPDNAAVDDMTIQIGSRTVRGVIKKKEEARAIYENAKQTGHVAALLDQERPNIFTQAVANIMPGEQVVVTISYLQTLEYADGGYEFVFPMVVGPRYIPGQPVGTQAGGWAPDTDKVPDASKITPPVTPEDTRAGHDISIELALDAGVPIQRIHSGSHQIDVARNGQTVAAVKLRNEGEIPNKDFILKYNVAGEQISDALLSQAAAASAKSAGGYFTFILQPPARIPESDITPKEFVFVLDTSGSMFGFPLEKAKELINHALDELYPGDTFNLITFSGDTHILFPEPVYPTTENIRLAKNLLNSRTGGGGTEMMKAIRAALVPSDSQNHLRVVCFITDGYVGNDLEIIGEVQKHANARVFAYGVGSSVNRFLIEGMAKAGRGESEVVTLNEKAGAAAHRLYERMRSPLLTDVSIDWGGLPVTDISPARLPDLFSGRPLVISGRYTNAARGTIRLKGKRAGEDFEREIPVILNAGANQIANANSNETPILATFWARRKIDDLMSLDWASLQNGTTKPEVQQQITQLGLDYRLMTQFTSFVAVEDRIATTNGKPQRVEVPVEMPEGVSREGIFGEADEKSVPLNGRAFIGGTVSRAGRVRGGGASAGVAAGVPAGIAGPVMNGSPSLVAPPPVTAPAYPSYGMALYDQPIQGAILPKATGERATLESKLHPKVLAILDCWKNSGQDCKLDANGNLEVEVWLVGANDKVVTQIKALGFTLAQQRSAGTVLIGHLPVDKLEELAKISAVRFVSPVRK